MKHNAINYTNAEKQGDDVNMAIGNGFMQSRAFSGASVHITTSVQQQTATSTTTTLTTCHLHTTNQVILCRISIVLVSFTAPFLSY